MVTVQQLLDDLLNPLLGFFGVLVRALGALALGYVAGQVVRYTLLHKIQMRFYVPLIFLGVILLLVALAFGQWGSPGAVGMFGLGVLAGYLFMRETRLTGSETGAQEMGYEEPAETGRRRRTRAQQSEE